MGVGGAVLQKPYQVARPALRNTTPPGPSGFWKSQTHSDAHTDTDTDTGTGSGSGSDADTDAGTGSGTGSGSGAIICFDRFVLGFGLGRTCG